MGKSYPETTLEEPVLLFNKNNNNVTMGAEPDIPKFPVFPNIVSVENDASQAKTACSVGHVIKRRVESLCLASVLLSGAVRRWGALLGARLAALGARAEALHAHAERAHDAARALDLAAQAVKMMQAQKARWEDKGIEVGGRRLTNLRFADDIVLFAPSASTLEHMLQDLSTASLQVGLSMNRSKTKIMSNSATRKVTVDGQDIQYVNEYIYLGQLVSFENRQDKEIDRRIENAWKSYWSMKQLMKGNLPLSLKRKLVDMCILPVLTYGAQTWSLTEHQKTRLKVCQRAMERSLLGVKLTDRVRNTILRSQTRIVDVGVETAKLKWNWAGHVCRMHPDRWAKIATEWVPGDGRRRRGRPRRRWRDDLDKFDNNWAESAQDRRSGGSDGGVESWSAAAGLVAGEAGALRAAAAALLARHAAGGALRAEWDAAARAAPCPHATRLHIKARTLVERLRDSWQHLVRDRATRTLTYNDEQFHVLERITLGEAGRRARALLARAAPAARARADAAADWYKVAQTVSLQTQILDKDVAQAELRLLALAARLQAAEQRAKGLLAASKSESAPSREAAAAAAGPRGRAPAPGVGAAGAGVRALLAAQDDVAAAVASHSALLHRLTALTDQLHS
ncbi:unnamed protein product [Plutella xylostella]|uniref:(diamondback moth) hypothetical protein n=2 Tax=Plutella xylostella TaxID=51655 RepID=A0A8S4G824_PLUXY|nr:unnamed protein product [Plutella xylostella]